MSWRLWDMLPFNFEALRIDHISWSSVLSTWDSWDQTLSHLASRRLEITFRLFGTFNEDEVCCRSPPSRRWRWMRCHGVTTQRETVRKREKDTIFCETYENWNGFLRKFSHNLQLFHIVSSFVAEFSSGGSVLVAQFSSFTTCLHTSHCHTILQMLIINLFFSMLSFTKPVTSICSVQVAGSIAVSSLQRAKHWLHAVALQGAPKIVREIASMTNKFGFVWWDFSNCHIQTKSHLLSMSFNPWVVSRFGWKILCLESVFQGGDVVNPWGQVPKPFRNPVMQHESSGIWSKKVTTIDVWCN